jgi:tetratricopeptide (TPR) repeat protein
VKRHPTDLHLESFFLDLGEEARGLLLHLCDCERCRRKLRQRTPRHPAETPDPEPYPPPPELAGNPRALAFAAGLVQERIDAPELLVELLRKSPGERVRLLGNEPRFRTWAVVELLAERSLATATRDSAGAEELGALALLLTTGLDATFYGSERIEDLRARAWGHVANARRVRSDLRGAEEAFTSAWDHLGRGTRDPFLEAVLLDLEGSVRRDQRRLADASALFQKAEDLFRESGDSHRAGRSLVKLSTVHYFEGEIDQAIAVLTRAVPLIDAELEPRLRLCAQHNLVDYLTIAGRIPEAKRAYQETRALYREFAEPWVQNRRKWVRARILRGLGKPDLAESLFLAARDGFLAEGIPYDTALLSLELATLYAERGRTADLKRLASEMLPIFTGLQIHREALAALTFLKQAIEAEQAGLGLIEAVADYLRRAQFRPELRFEKPDEG